MAQRSLYCCSKSELLLTQFRADYYIPGASVSLMCSCLGSKFVRKRAAPLIKSTILSRGVFYAICRSCGPPRSAPTSGGLGGTLSASPGGTTTRRPIAPRPFIADRSIPCEDHGLPNFTVTIIRSMNDTLFRCWRSRLAGSFLQSLGCTANVAEETLKRKTLHG